MPIPLIAMLVASALYVLWPAPSLTERWNNALPVPAAVSDGTASARSARGNDDVALSTVSQQSYIAYAIVGSSTMPTEVMDSTTTYPVRVMDPPSTWK